MTRIIGIASGLLVAAGFPASVRQAAAGDTHLRELTFSNSAWV